MAGEGSNFANQNTNSPGNRRGGRPNKEITWEELLSCKGKLKEAAVKLGVSERIVRREMQRLTGYDTWTTFQHSPWMKDKDEMVPITVTYGGITKPFVLAEIEEQNRFQKLQKLIEQGFELQAGTYDVKWYVGGMGTLYITHYENVKACFGVASNRQFNHIALTVENKEFGVVCGI